MTMETTYVKNKMFLAGQWVSRPKEMEVRDPQDNSMITTVPAATEDDVLFAIEEAKAGQIIAAAIPVHERIAILNRAANWIQDHQERYAVLIAREGSKTIREARKEARRCVETLRISAEEARRLNGETIAFDQMPGSENRVGYYYRFPIGIVSAITPFNDPLNLVAHKVGPAIAAGNAVIVKPAPATPLSALLLAEAFDRAGLPQKVLSVITGHTEELGDGLITHPAIRMISFTGGLSTGQKIIQKAGLKKMSMELGSNSPVIVLEDAELSDAVESSVSGAFWAAGQNCLGVQRIYAHQAIYEEFVQRFVERTKQYRFGPKLSEETDMGPMISEKEALRVESWVNEAVEKGAKMLCGGKRIGAFYEPTVLVDVPADCRVATEEVFGPVVSIFSVPDLDNAIEASNAVPFGLQAGIFTKDVERAFQAIQRLEVGGVMINDSSDYRIDAMPFGGVKGSGIGREGIRFTLQEMTEPRVVCFKLAR